MMRLLLLLTSVVKQLVLLSSANDGKQYGVNSIHAIANGDGTVDIVALPEQQVIYDNLIYGNITITDSPAGTSENGAVNALNALFANLPLGAGGSYVPTYPTLAGVDIVNENTRGTTGAVTTKSDGTTPHLYYTNCYRYQR